MGPGWGGARRTATFADRQALAAAVYDCWLANLQRLADLHDDDPDLLGLLVLGVAERRAQVPGLVAVLSATPEGCAALLPITDRARWLVATPSRQRTPGATYART